MFLVSWKLRPNVVVLSLVVHPERRVKDRYPAPVENAHLINNPQ